MRQNIISKYLLVSSYLLRLSKIGEYKRVKRLDNDSLLQIEFRITSSQYIFFCGNHEISMTVSSKETLKNKQKINIEPIDTSNSEHDETNSRNNSYSVHLLGTRHLFHQTKS